jgi:hypothetical protein
VAIFSHADDDNYGWPSQACIARETGLDERSVRRVLARLAKLGILRRMRAVDLPPQQASIVLGPRRDGGSGRSYRGGAYVLVAPADWAAKAVTGPDWPSDYRARLALHNHQDEPPPASLDSFTFGEEGHMIPVLPGRTVQILDEEKIQEGSSERRAREAAHG